MKNSQLINYLKSNTIELLTEEFGIKVNHYDNFDILSYSQIDSPKSNPVVQECRGHVVCQTNNEIKFLCRPFDRFFNLGEMNFFEKDFDVPEYSILEKLDGSMINLWWNEFKNQWNFSTRKMGYAEGSLSTNKSKTFYNLIMDVIKDINKISDHLDKNKTYIFELTSPENRVVTRYINTKLTLLSIRNNMTGEYDNYNQMKNWIKIINIPKIELIKLYKINNYDNILKMIDLLPAINEGYVAWNEKNNHRVKIKNPSYVAIAHLKNNGIMAEKRIALLVLNNDEKEYLSYFPEDEYRFVPFIMARQKMKEDIDKIIEKTKEINDMKELSILIKNKNDALKYILFNIKRGKLSYNEAYSKLSEQAKIKMINAYV